ncbi:MAG: hypothetical protein KA210_08630 [Bacteroidia bacterium]|nr:hypothetical protein [Bacteroidia bacterium]
MKKLLILGLIIFSNLSCKAQETKPLETKMDYYNPETGLPKNISYFKDINHLLDKYIGTWKGSLGAKNYEFIITKNKSTYEGLSEDELLIRYFITTSSGSVIEDTRSTTDIKCPIKGDYIKKSNYVLRYAGKDTQCGQIGDVFIGMVPNTNNTKMGFLLLQDHVLLDSETCPNGRVPQVLPLTKVLLTKQ